MSHPHNGRFIWHVRTCTARRRSAFTLVELLIVIAIIALLASAMLFSMHGALEEAKIDRTKSQVKRISEVIEERWEGYQTRTVPLKTSGMTPKVAAEWRLAGIRELMRMELPDRKEDLINIPAAASVGGNQQTRVLAAAPSLWRSYRRKADALIKAKHGAAGDWTTSHWDTRFEDAECLYLILSTLNDDGSSASFDLFTAADVGDVDNDGMPEILDAWRNPIRFIRWPAGFPSFRQSRAAATDPDSFDPLKVDPRWSLNSPEILPYMLFPLVMSAGRDGDLDIVMKDYDPSVTPPVDKPTWYAMSDSATYNSPVSNDPYLKLPVSSAQLSYKVYVGLPFQTSYGYTDNIHSHGLEVK